MTQLIKDKLQGQAIAIDGPAASGKSTLAKGLAEYYGLVMVNSGEMYRAVTWLAIQKNLDLSDEEALLKIVDELNYTVEGYTSAIEYQGQKLTTELRLAQVNAGVSQVAALPDLRAKLVEIQRSYLNKQGVQAVVMEGRDIGSVVFPDTPYKFYLKATQEVRQSRRADQGEVDVIAKRDAADSARKASPLVIADGAQVVDVSNLSIEAVRHQVIELIESV